MILIVPIAQSDRATAF